MKKKLIHKKDKEDRASHNLFRETLDDIKKLTREFTNKNEKAIMGLAKKNNQKMPLTHLMGKRKKIKQRYQDEKKRGKEENVQYDSSSKLLNSDFIQKIHVKDNYIKNKYKYSDMKAKSIGNYKNGILNLSKDDLNNIMGPRSNNNQKPSRGFDKVNKQRMSKKIGKKKFKSKKNKKH